MIKSINLLRVKSFYKRFKSHLTKQILKKNKKKADFFVDRARSSQSLIKSNSRFYQSPTSLKDITKITLKLRQPCSHKLVFGLKLGPFNSKIVSNLILWLLFGNPQISSSTNFILYRSSPGVRRVCQAPISLKDIAKITLIRI